MVIWKFWLFSSISIFFPSVAPQKQFRSSGAGGFFGFKREMRGEMVDGI